MEIERTTTATDPENELHARKSRLGETAYLLLNIFA